MVNEEAIIAEYFDRCVRAAEVFKSRLLYNLNHLEPQPNPKTARPRTGKLAAGVQVDVIRQHDRIKIEYRLPFPARFLEEGHEIRGAFFSSTKRVAPRFFVRKTQLETHNEVVDILNGVTV